MNREQLLAFLMEELESLVENLKSDEEILIIVQKVGETKPGQFLRAVVGNN
jgi:hypothetical protein